MTDRVQTNFVQQAARLGLQLTERQLEQFEIYYALLVEWNGKMNLTGITEREAVYEKHYYDSLTLVTALDLAGSKSLVDIGSGAGFPSVPLAIVFPHLRITIIDALAKRIRFLEEVTSRLGLGEVSCLHSRAEDAARDKNLRDGYDVATARAVARLAVLNEFCLPFVRPGGLFVAMKGTDIDSELRESRYSLSKLNGKLKEVKQLTLPGEGADRHLVVCQKTGPTPAAYPRKPGTPLKSPLVAPTIGISSRP